MTKVKTVADAAASAEAIAERDARTFRLNGWPMPDEWPLTWEAATDAIEAGDPFMRRELVQVMRVAGQRRWSLRRSR